MPRSNLKVVDSSLVTCKCWTNFPSQAHVYTTTLYFRLFMFFRCFDKALVESGKIFSKIPLHLLGRTHSARTNQTSLLLLVRGLHSTIFAIFSVGHETEVIAKAIRNVQYPCPTDSPLRVEVACP